MLQYRGKTAEEQRLREGAFGGRQRLASRHAWLSSVLDKAGIAHLPSQAGLFTWLDLRPWLPSDGGGTNTTIYFRISLCRRMLQRRGGCWCAEAALSRWLMDEVGVAMTPGCSMGMPAPGFFRIVFSAASDDEFATAMQRIEKHFARS